MIDENKIQALSEKLLKDGVERGNQERERVIAQAKAEAEAILNEARAQAKDIEETARKAAAAMEANTKGELKMCAAQALAALRVEVADMVCGEVVRAEVSQLTRNTDTMNEFVLRLAEHWGEDGGLVISAPDADRLKALFASDARRLLDKGVEIRSVNGQKAMFEIAPADGSYKVSFGEEEFEAFFKAFLRPQLADMLFK